MQLPRHPMQGAADQMHAPRNTRSATDRAAAVICRRAHLNQLHREVQYARLLVQMDIRVGYLLISACCISHDGV